MKKSSLVTENSGWKLNPIFCDKGNMFNKTLLVEKDKILSEDRYVAELTNNYFISISKKIQQ